MHRSSSTMPRGTRGFPLCAAMAVTLAAASALPLAAQTAPEPGRLVELGTGAGIGSGRFGGAGMAGFLRIGRPRSGANSLGFEVVALVGREHYAEGGALFPDFGRTRTSVRLAATATARLQGPSGAYASTGLGVGTFTGIDTSVMDAAPLRTFGALVATVGAGMRWTVGGLDLTPRIDLMLHAGSAIRVTGVTGIAIGIF